MKQFKILISGIAILFLLALPISFSLSSFDKGVIGNLTYYQPCDSNVTADNSSTNNQGVITDGTWSIVSTGTKTRQVGSGSCFNTGLSDTVTHSNVAQYQNLINFTFCIWLNSTLDYGVSRNFFSMAS